jgi:rubrerythrin
MSLSLTLQHGVSMDTTQNTGSAALVALLNDLLQLDHDAIAAYRLALRELESVDLRLQLQAHLADHERHVDELEKHIEEAGGMKMSLPHLTGAFKLAVQAAAAPGSDRAVLLAFKANEMQARDKYARATTSADLPAGVRLTVQRAAADERRHYDWAVNALEEMGAELEDRDVQATRAFARVHGRTADGVEAVERAAMRLTEGTRRVLANDSVRTVVTAGLALVGAGVVIRQITRRR